MATPLQIGDDVSPLLKRVSGLVAVIAPHLPVVPACGPGILSTDPEVERRFASALLCYQGLSSSSPAASALMASARSIR